jgi:hypothetical protein
MPADWFEEWFEVDKDGKGCRTKKPGLRHGDTMTLCEHKHELSDWTYDCEPFVVRKTLDWRGDIEDLRIEG